MRARWGPRSPCSRRCPPRSPDQLARRDTGVHLPEAAGQHVEDEPPHLVPVRQVGAEADAVDRLPHVGIEVGEGLEGKGRPDAGLLLDLCLQIVIAEAEHPAAGVVDQHHLAGAENALGDDQRADDVIGGDAARVADEVGIPGLQPEDGGKVDPPVHAADHGDVPGRDLRCREPARTS
jgi:hypothetical protein